RGYFTPIAQSLWNVFFILAVNSFIERVIEIRSHLPDLHFGFVQSDADQPATKLAFALEVPKMAQCLEKSVLGAIFRFSLVVQERHRTDIDHAFIGSNQLVIELSLAGEYPLNQFSF